MLSSRQTSYKLKSKIWSVIFWKMLHNLMHKKCIVLNLIKIFSADVEFKFSALKSICYCLLFVHYFSEMKTKRSATLSSAETDSVDDEWQVKESFPKLSFVRISKLHHEKQSKVSLFKKKLLVGIFDRWKWCTKKCFFVTKNQASCITITIAIIIISIVASIQK